MPKLKNRMLTDFDNILNAYLNRVVANVLCLKRYCTVLKEEALFYALQNLLAYDFLVSAQPPDKLFVTY